MFESLKQRINGCFPVTPAAGAFLEGLKTALELVQAEAAEQVQTELSEQVPAKSLELEQFLEEIRLRRDNVSKEIEDWFDLDSRGFPQDKEVRRRLSVKLEVYDSLLKWKK
jgi:hypothetical protein